MGIKLKDILEATSNFSTDGEPDTGFIRGGKTRKLGKLEGKPEPWFEKGGYKQIDFPIADRAYEKGDKTTQMVYVLKRLKMLVINMKDSIS